MEINPEIYETLKEFKIDKDQGILALLGIYFKVDINKTCTPDTIKGINLTKIVVKDYDIFGRLVWNIPLFKGQQTEWGWVEEWNNGFRKINPARTSSLNTVTTRMIEWFRKYPKYRQEDVVKATFMYLKSVRDPQYLKLSEHFILEGKDTKDSSKTSPLLGWCENLSKGGSANNLKGRIL